MQHINHFHVIRCFSLWFWKDELNKDWPLKSTLTNISDMNKQHRRRTAALVIDEDFGPKCNRLKGRHAENMSGSKWRCSSVSAAAYGTMLTTKLQLRSDQILTRLAASIHVTNDGPADLRVDESWYVKARNYHFIGNPSQFGHLIAWCCLFTASWNTCCSHLGSPWLTSAIRWLSFCCFEKCYCRKCITDP